MTDTIAAVATGTGRTAIGILRLSGPRSLDLVNQLFHPMSGRSLADCGPGRLVYGRLLDEEGRLLDECMAVYARGPHSYTGEDTAELQCHGAPAVLEAALEALVHLGARQARAGEFTQRSFLNGRMDLTQAEAVIDLIDSETTAAARCAASQLTGTLGRRLEEIYDQLVTLAAHFDVVLDYSDEDLEPFRPEEITDTVGRAAEDLGRLAATARRGRRLREGVTCAIVGPPNSGKSSLLNALLGYDRAIVTPVPGTTRDTVEEHAALGGVLLRLVDTAGLRETGDAVERIGVQRALEALGRAELVLVLEDGTADGAAFTRPDQAREDAVVLYLATKSDLPDFRPPAAPEGESVLEISSRTGDGLDTLEALVQAHFAAGDLEDSGEVLTSRRQAEAVGRASECLHQVQLAMEAGMTPDAVLSDVELAMDAIGEVIGRSVKDDVTERIFSRFCVGK